MSKSRHTEAQIITLLKQVDAERTAEDVAREQGVSKHTIYAWEAKYGGMDVSEAEEVKHLRDENSRLKKLVADLSLDEDLLRSVIRKTPWARRAAAGSAALAGGVPCQRAPRLRADGGAEIEWPVPKPEMTAMFRSGCGNWRVSIRALATGGCICTCTRRWE